MKKVVVTGLGVVSPVGNNIDDFWSSIKNGKNGICDITKFDTTDYKVKIAAEVKNFDPTECMEKNEIRRNDLFCQYAMSAATQAVNDSKILGNIDSDRFGVYVGSGIGGLNTIVTDVGKMLEKGPRRVSPYVIPMMIANIASGNIAIKFKANGPTLPIVTACATATNCIGEAYRAIKYGYADAILAGGTEAPITTIGIAGFTNCMALCTNNDKDNASIPFDKRRSGFVMGEGAGVVVLEEYEHAVKRGAKIYAEICGYGNNCDAYHVTAPDPNATQSTKVMRMVLKESNYKNSDIVYINAHGTSTPLNDKIETLAIKNAFDNKLDNVFVSSTKSMTGHMLGAAGAVEAICSVLAIKDGVVPPTINYREKDDECDLDYTPNIKKDADIELSLSNSLGFGGHNACIAFRKV